MAFFDRFKAKKKDSEEKEIQEAASEKIEVAEEENEAVIEEAAEETVAPPEGKAEPEAQAETLESEEESEMEKLEEEAEEKIGIFQRFKRGLSKTRENISGKIESLVKSTRKIDDDFFEELEDILIQADVGMTTSMKLVDNIRASVKKQKLHDPEEVIGLIKDEIRKILDTGSVPLQMTNDLTVIMVVGVNGAGKTTTIAKLANRFKKEGKKVLLAAGDTFRAAAIDQLQIWADRIGVELIKHQEGADPGAVVYDAMNAAKARKSDVLIIDTAGRLQNKANLMKEISKVRKVIEREIPEAPHEVLLVLDATTGQNAISQARIFGEATGVTGIVLTKLDGTAKGGIVIAVAEELDIPVKLVGIGEGINDLRDFSPEAFAEALLGDDTESE